MLVSQKKKKISWPGDLVAPLYQILESECEVDQNKEHFWAIGLNNRNIIQYIELVSLGIVNRTLVHPREVFRMAIIKGVTSLIVSHNHPGGETHPSEDDLAVTRKLKDAGQIVGIKLLDHIIIGSGKFDGFYSFNEHSVL